MNEVNETADPQQVFGHYFRHYFLLTVFAVVVLLLCVRAVKLQVLENESLQRHGEARAMREVTINAWRGAITDRHGTQLAVSTPVPSVVGVPGKLLEQRDRFPELGVLMELDDQALLRRVRQRYRRGKDFFYLRRHVDPQLAQQVDALQIPGLYLIKEHRRYYPAAEMMAHVVGFANVDDRGQEGMELAYDEVLSGRQGKKKVLIDSRGQIVEHIETIMPAVSGTDLALSIDQRLQYLAWRELKASLHQHQARAGMVVVLDVRTGEVLAMVNQPSYNPNNRSSLDMQRARNRAATDVFEPGSTMKPFTIAAALVSGAYTPDSEVDTSPGSFRVGGHLIRDMRDYGKLGLRSVIVKSSNVGASKVALSLDTEAHVDLLSRFGFGESSGMAFPGESPGFLPRHPHWSDVEIATLSFGYGLSVTALQLARAYAAIANHGRLLPVSLLRLDEPPAGRQVIPPRVAHELCRMMEGVVSPEGTARRAMLPAYRVAGKTGTVHKVGSDGYQMDQYMSLFVGIVPASRPRLAMVVVIDEPKGEHYYGGLVAAPVFAGFMDGALRILNIAPDRLEEKALHMLVDSRRPLRPRPPPDRTEMVSGTGDVLPGPVSKQGEARDGI